MRAFLRALWRGPRRHLVHFLSAAVFTLVAVIVPAGPASAHAQLEWTEPVQSSVLSTSPRQVVLHFGEPVEIDFGSLRVIGPDGKRVDEGGTHHPPGDSHAVAISLPDHLPRGTNVVAWRVISADSHPVHGAFIFSVGTATGGAKANALATSLNSQSGNTTVGVIFWFIRLGAFVGLAGLVGLAAVVALVWPAGGKNRRIAKMLWTSWSLLLVCTLAGIAIQGVYAASLPLTDIVHPSLFNEVLRTRFGEVQILRAALLIVFLPVLLALRGRLGRASSRVPWWVPLGAIVSIGLLSTPGLAGHASTGADPAFGLILDSFHLGAVVIWLGGLAMLAALLIPGLPERERPERMGPITTSVSAYAFSAVMVVVVTGVVQSLRQVGSLYALFNTVYGRTLLVKVALVAVLIAVGAVSRWIVLGERAVPSLVRRVGPRPRRRLTASAFALQMTPSRGRLAKVPDAQDMPDQSAARDIAAVEPPAPGVGSRNKRSRGLLGSVIAEIVIALGVLAVTALLVNAVPAKQAASQPFSQTFNALGVQVNAVVNPARAATANQFHFYVLGRLGQPLPIPELDASISLPSQGIGPLTIPLRVAAPGHYLAARFDIPLAGDWNLKLTVRTTAIDEQELFATLPVH